MLAAGLEGITKKYTLPDPVEENIFKWDITKRENSKIDTLPDNLFEAVKYMEKSELVKETLGEHIFNKFIENKKIEWDRYRTYVTDYEMKNYLSIL